MSGYVHIGDFGVSKIYRPNNSHETSGTPGYMAPEIMLGLNHTFSADFYSLGVICYEMSMGIRPYNGKTRQEIRKDMLSHQVRINKGVLNDIENDFYFRDFVNELLQRKIHRRLGALKGIRELKLHPFFKDFSFDDLRKRRMQAPFRPDKYGNYDKILVEKEEKISEGTENRYRVYRNQEGFETLFKGYEYATEEKEGVDGWRGDNKNELYKSHADIALKFSNDPHLPASLFLDNKNSIFLDNKILSKNLKVEGTFTEKKRDVEQMKEYILNQYEDEGIKEIIKKKKTKIIKIKKSV